MPRWSSSVTTISSHGATNNGPAGSNNNQGKTARSKTKASQAPDTVSEYNKIKKQYSGQRKLYEDPDFHAVDTSIFYSRSPPRPFEWKRPSEIVKNPKFFVGGASRFDVRQGELGDCWLLAAVASLSLHQELFNHVVPTDQDFDHADYAGLFRFRFWQFGKWTDVIVDDRLPTYYGKLVFLHSTDSNEFWSALLEKAYAKLMGSYEALRGGSTSEAMEDFTGGITLFYDLREASLPADLFKIIQIAMKRCSLLGCSIEADPSVVEAKLPNGLIKGHAYSITDVRKVTVRMPSGRTGEVELLRIRNPWGNEDEWNGAWSDKSPEWTCLSADEKRQLDLRSDDDGEFWMNFQDFKRHFEKLEICNLGPDSLGSDNLGGKQKRRWEMCLENGSWTKRVSAGGCRNYIDTFWTNPQFRVKVVDPDEDDEENLGTVVIGLMQKDRRKKRKEGLELHTIGYTIYRAPDSNAQLDLKFFKYNASVAKSPAFINMREVCGRHKLAPGEYAIIPSTFAPQEESDFILRIFSESATESQEIDEDTSMDDVQPSQDMTPQEEAQVATLRDAFQKIAGEDMEVDAFELRDILNAAFKKEFRFDGFGLETCRSMVSMMDVDQSGKLGFDEFKLLWDDLRLWKTVFKTKDADHSGNFNSYELRQALGAVGFKVSNKVFNSLVMRYATKEGVIMFDDYILICVRLKTVFETFKAQTKDYSSKGAVFSLDEFIQTIMYV